MQERDLNPDAFGIGSISAPLRSAQSRRPLDVVRPISCIVQERDLDPDAFGADLGKAGMNDKKDLKTGLSYGKVFNC